MGLFFILNQGVNSNSYLPQVEPGRPNALGTLALLGLKPWLSLRETYARYLESPGTKAYSIAEARVLFSKFNEVNICTVLTHGDLLESGAGQRYRGPLMSLARKL